MAHHIHIHLHDDFEEEKHPRDPSGKWTSGSGSHSVNVQGGKPEQHQEIHKLLSSLPEEFLKKAGLRHVELASKEANSATHHSGGFVERFANTGAVTLSNRLRTNELGRYLTHEAGHLYHFQHGPNAQQPLLVGRALRADREKMNAAERKQFAYFHGKQEEAIAEAVSHTLHPGPDTAKFKKAFPNVMSSVREHLMKHGGLSK